MKYLLKVREKECLKQTLAFSLNIVKKNNKKKK